MSKRDTRTLLIVRGNGEQIQIDIPQTWKVTFGPAVAGVNRDERNGRMMPMALRVYESEKMQRAIFTDVVSFRDLSIPMRVKKNNVQEKVGFVECDGVRKATTFQATTTEWVEDRVDNAPPVTPTALLQMPTDEEIFGEKD